MIPRFHGRTGLQLMQFNNPPSTKNMKTSHSKKTMGRSPSRLALLLIPVVFVCFGLLPNAQGVVPAPDGDYPNGNTAEGHNALFSLTSGGYNTAVGFFSLRQVTTGNFNTAVGAGTLLSNTADENTAIGAGALLSNTTGGANTATGAQALLSNTNGADNNAFGYRALVSNTTGAYNNAVGVGALASNTDGLSNNAFGLNALVSNTTGDVNNAVGYEALFSNTIGNGNNAVGYRSLYLQETGYGNNAFGIYALNHHTDGDRNNAFGAEALYSNVTGEGNTAIGDSAGRNVDGNFNICIGAGVEGDFGENNTIRIGDNLPTKPGYAACFIGGINGQTTANGTAVFIDANGKLGTTTSSLRFKEHITSMDKASEALLALKPVAFRYKKDIDPAGTLQLGLVAEDVEKVNPDLVVHDKEGKPYTVRYDQVNAMLLNEFLKARRQIDAQQKQIDALTAGLQKVSAELEARKSAPQVVNNP